MESLPSNQHTDLQTDLRYQLHKNYLNTKKMTIKAEGDFYGSMILEELSLFKNIHSGNILFLENGESLYCLFNNIGLISEIKSSKKKHHTIIDILYKIH